MHYNLCADLPAKTGSIATRQSTIEIQSLVFGELFGSGRRD
jgi:hypothetical protein